MNLQEIKRFQKIAGILNEDISLEEAKEIDQKLAQIILDRLISINAPFEQEVYLNLNDRAHIKHLYGDRLPMALAGPTKYMLIGSILTPLVGTNVYMDGEDLVKGDKTVMTISDQTRWPDVAKALGL
jgi:hypothetical protein